MKVVLAGASGSGKTTLAKALAENFKWNFTENSAGLIMGKEHKRILSERFGYGGDWGQKKVINHSHKVPEFGRAFQEYILAARYGLMQQEENAVYDRSSLDPIVFYLNQIVHNDQQEDSGHFIRKCVAGLRNVDLILRIPLQNPHDEIENNESRVNNWYFQKKVDLMFDLAMDMMVKENNAYPELLGKKRLIIKVCPTWDWDQRLAWGINSIARLVNDQY